MAINIHKLSGLPTISLGTTIMTPPTSPKIGAYIQPLVINNIAKVLSLNKILLLDKGGLSAKDYAERKQDYLENFIGDLNEYKIIENVDFARDMIKSIQHEINEGYIKEKEIDVFTCECGKLFFPKNKEVFLNKVTGKVAIKTVNGYSCKLCNTVAKTKHINSLLLDIASYDIESLDLVVFPNRFNNYVASTSNRLKTREILITKMTVSDLVVNGYNVNNDFMWAMLPFVVNEKTDIDLHYFVTSNKTLYHFIYAALISRVFGKKDYVKGLIVTPYYSFRNSIDIDFWRLSQNIVSKINGSRDIIDITNTDLDLKKYNNSVKQIEMFFNSFAKH